MCAHSIFFTDQLIFNLILFTSFWLHKTNSSLCLTHTRTPKKKNAERLHLMAEFTAKFSFVSFYVMISVFFPTLGWATILLQMVLKLNNVVFVLHFRVVVFILFHFIILSVSVS